MGIRFYRIFAIYIFFMAAKEMKAHVFLCKIPIPARGAGMGIEIALSV